VIPLICFFNVIFFSVNLSSPFEWRFNTRFKRSLSHVVAALLYLILFAQQLEVLTLALSWVTYHFLILIFILFKFIFCLERAHNSDLGSVF
jgi:hypothetical protein